MVEKSSSVLTRTKSKRSDHGKVRKLKKALTKRFSSKSYETISLSKKDDLKKNVITFIHSNGLIKSDVNIKNKTHHINTNDNMDKVDKKRNLYSSNKENVRERRYSLPSPEILKDLQNHKSKLSPLTLDSLKSFSSNIKDDIHSHSIKQGSNTSNLKPNQNSTSLSTPLSNTKIHQNDSIKFKTQKTKKTVVKMVKSPRPKSKLSKSVTLPISPSPSIDSKPSAPSLNEMYLEEMKDHQKFLQYKNLVNSEQDQLTSEPEGLSLSSSPPLVPSVTSIKKLSNVEIKNPFEPPFTTLSPNMTIATTVPTIPARTSSVNSLGSFKFNTTSITTKSPFNEVLSHLPKPSSLSFYTQSPSNFDSIPPKINGTRSDKDYSIEKVIPKIDLISRRDSLDFYFDKLSQPSKSSSYSSTRSSSQSSFSGPSYTSFEPDIPSLEVSQHRMMAEPQPTYYNVAHSNFNQVINDMFSVRSHLEDKVEETKFQMMIAITQLNLINEQLDILNCNNLK